MGDYVIYTDSACDVGNDLLESWDVKKRSLTFKFDDEEKEYSSDEMSPAQFYAEMKKGRVAKTAAINMKTFYDAFEEELKAGRDVLYIGMASGISNTPNAAKLAAKELEEEYPDRKVIALDAFTASVGQGLLVYKASLLKKEGKSIDEVADYVENNKMKYNVWFIVDDLIYLKRGGRISATAAFAGGVLQLKPVLRVDEEGKLENVSKVRGRSQSIKSLAKKYMEMAVDPSNADYFIGQGDCFEEAKSLAAMIEKEGGNRVKEITDITPVIGAHTGPGIMVLGFIGEHR
ncbi:MAG: DegV family protein [Lachnospiraceae bacterium]|nr:DegV family protein [Lachnospiraceae bacterium]